MLTSQLVRDLLQAALNEVLQSDPTLLARNLREECITHRLAMYLERSCRAVDPAIRVDIEFDRDLDGQGLRNVGGADRRTDLVLHRRDTNASNLLALEAIKEPRMAAERDDRIEQLTQLMGQREFRNACVVGYRTQDPDAWIEVWL